jgi:hypothetical protein
MGLLVSTAGLLKGYHKRLWMRAAPAQAYDWVCWFIVDELRGHNLHHPQAFICAHAVHRKHASIA